MLKTFRVLASALLASTIVCAFATPAAGQVSLTALGNPYTQNFDALPASGSATWTNNSTITGWYHARTGTGTTIVANDGASNAGNLYSYGTGTNADRALGSIGSGGAGAGSFFWGVRLQNNTGATITSLDIAYIGEQWRNGGGTGLAQTVTFSYLIGSPTVAGTLAEFQSAGVGVASLNFTSPVFSTTASALNGNLAANRTALSATISGLNIPNGTEIMLRWSDPDHPSNDHGLAIDDFSVTPHGAVASEPTLSINDVTLAEGNSGTTNFTFTVSLNAPAGAGGVTFDIATSDGTASAPSDYVAKALVAQTIAPGASTYPFTVTVNGDTATEGNETFFVTVTNVSGATVGDGDGLGTIQNDDVGITPIHDIQGSGSTSPLVGQAVTTAGVVTGVKGNGFFIQAAEADYDGDPNTSEGIFVFTSSAPPAAAAVGNLVTVTATVSEFIPNSDPNSSPTTELTSPSVSVLSTGNPLPSPIVLAAANTDPSGPIDQLERFEGMRVKVNSLTTISPTEGNVSEANATSTSNGAFYGVITGIARPFREPGVQVPDPLPAGSPASVPRFDANPERLRIETSTLTGSVALNVTSNVILSNVVGPLDYRFRTYTILTDPASPPVAETPNMILGAVRSATSDEFTAASFNMERFFDTVNDPGVSDVALTATAFNNRLNKASLAIRNVLQSPDIIGVEEMENLSTLQAVAQKVNSDAVAAGQPDPGYQAYLVEGNDVGGIDVGFLVKSPRVTVVDVTQFGKATTYTEPGGAVALLNDRPPLVLRAIINSATHAPYPVTVIVNHLRSLSGVDDPADGDRVRAKRRAQAEFLADLIQSRQIADPTERIVSVGDYNAFQFNDGYVDSIGTIKGAPTPANQVVLASGDLVNPDLADLVDFVQAAQRYSFSFGGNAQELDHVLVTTGAQSRLVAIDLQYGRMDADFPETYRTDANRPERLSDHDPLVAYFSLDNALDCTTAQADPSTVYATSDHAMQSIAITGITALNGSPIAITVDAICQDESTTSEAIPAYAVDGSGIGTSTASVRAERNGVRQNPGNGRVYHIFFTADDGGPGRCSGQVKVGVPFNVTQPALDNGALFDSTSSNGAACGVGGVR